MEKEPNKYLAGWSDGSGSKACGWFWGMKCVGVMTIKPTNRNTLKVLRLITCQYKFGVLFQYSKML